MTQGTLFPPSGGIERGRRRRGRARVPETRCATDIIEGIAAYLEAVEARARQEAAR